MVASFGQVYIPDSQGWCLRSDGSIEIGGGAPVVIPSPIEDPGPIIPD